MVFLRTKNESFGLCGSFVGDHLFNGCCELECEGNTFEVPAGSFGQVLEAYNEALLELEEILKEVKGMTHEAELAPQKAIEKLNHFRDLVNRFDYYNHKHKKYKFEACSLGSLSMRSLSLENSLKSSDFVSSKNFRDLDSNDEFQSFTIILVDLSDQMMACYEEIKSQKAG